jgi:2-oxoglutarate ferredoxin oxidoreductase subunit alpha
MNSAVAGGTLAKIVNEHVIEIISDSGEGAQTCGQMFADLCARNGNGIWTVEIIPAEIEPPSRSRAGASGYRIRLGSKAVTNAGDFADLVVAFNEQVLYSRIDSKALRPGTLLFVDNVVGGKSRPLHPPQIQRGD